MTQFASSSVEPKKPAMWGIATLVADVASIVNDVGKSIVNATSHNGTACCWCGWFMCP